MKLEKAIKIQTINNDHNPDFTDAERQAAHQLGVEALKETKRLRKFKAWFLRKLLPGETKE